MGAMKEVFDDQPQEMLSLQLSERQTQPSKA
jgi:hypothetical protein